MNIPSGDEGAQLSTFVLFELDAAPYVHRCLLVVGGAEDPTLASMSIPPSPPTFTEKPGQYLAFIFAYSRVTGRPPAEADLQRHFAVSAPSVHQMIMTLERRGLVRRTPGVARSVQVLVAAENLPPLR